MAERPKKVLRLHYFGPAVADEPTITFLSDPGELRLGVGGKSFLSIKNDQISLSGGTPSTFSIQGMSSSMKYAGMIQDLPFPMSIMPTTPYTPFPKQMIVPPLLDLLPTITQVANIASSIAGF